MRMQPCDAEWPSDHVSVVPWMPAPLWNPSQRALIGSDGPGGIMRPARSPAQALSGTCQDGFTCRSLMWYSPAGVSSPARPTAIGYVFASLRCRKRRSVYVSRFTTMNDGYFFG